VRNLTTIFELIKNSLIDAVYGNLGILYLTIFIVFIIYMAKLKIPAVPAILAGFVLLYAMVAVFSPAFAPLLGILLLFIGVGLAIIFFKIGRF